MFCKRLCIFLSMLTLICAIVPINSATTHKHVHGVVNKERTEDGSYTSRDAHHHDADGGHHSEFDHEAILGSVKEAEEFDSLPPEESKRRLSILITKMDLNGDHFIDRHELKAWILRSFKMLSEEEAGERFEDIDENNDERITWLEYMKESYGIEDESGENRFVDPSQLSEDEEKMVADDKILFGASDLNGDGWLNHDEFAIFNSPEEHPQMLPIILKQTLKDKDLDGDGKINFKEFLGETAKNHDKEWLITEKEKFDSDFDKDGDGVLNGNEILSWIVPSNDEVATDEVDHLFASADDDQDDRLSYEEILDNHDTFVGSEATDYGDHLHNIHHFDDEL